MSSALSALLPLLLLFVLPLLSSLFSSGPAPQGPAFRFDAAQPPETFPRTSYRFKVPYWVNPEEVEGFNNRKWRELDKKAEIQFVHDLNMGCEHEKQEQQRLMNEAQGWFLVDEEKMAEARRLEKKNCGRLNEMGFAT